MKNKILVFVGAISLCLLFLMIIIFSDSVMTSVSFSILIWKDNLIPAMFPFFVLSEIMINYGIVDFLSIIFERFMRKFFFLPGSATLALFGSMFSGFPSGTKYIVDLLKANRITLEDANYLIMFTHFSNPLFIIGSVGILMLGDVRIGYLILFIHFITNFIIAFIFRGRKRESPIINSSKAIIFNKKTKKQSFIFTLKNSIFNSFRTLLLILGIIIVFLVLSTIIDKLFSIDQKTSSLIGGFLEITQGIQKISYLDVAIGLKAAIITFFISFGGVSVHFQVLSIIEDTNIKYKYFFLARIIHAFISGILVFIFLW